MSISCGRLQAHLCPDPPDLVPPVSPSAARRAAAENDRCSGLVLMRATLITCWRSMMGRELFDERW
jgi:hypothetical protein